ncbi:hypothetical protein M758_11G152300 [Ceratodon purpureus]|nr:hypothetical protein M758_11G152300 [Ceratodon purpureus]KAG0601979.1 hypothetical protein M758_11G152300 [Ceratodon purpureus]
MIPIVAIAVLSLLATQCVGQPTPPSTLYAPYSMSIGAGSPTKGPLVLMQSPSTLWVLELDLDALGRCAITVRRLYNNPIPRNVWTANYFSKTPSGSTKCTLKFTKEGDLELYTLYKQKSLLTWTSGTANKGVTKMTITNNGDFQLLTAASKAVFTSFEWKEFAIVETQKLRLWESLKSPDAVQDIVDNDTIPVLLNKGEFVLAFDQSRDLVLRTTDAKPLVYWSLKRTLFKGGDLSQVAYAAVNPNNQGGIGLFTYGGKLVWNSTLPLQGYFGDAYFGIDKFGNLKDYYMYKGVGWFTQFQAIANDCDLPSFCGSSTLCSNSICSCPPKFVKTAGGCKHSSSVNNCKWKNFEELRGYDTVFDLYATPLKVSLASCKASCVTSCKCAGFSYNAKTGSCYQYDAFKTIRHVNDNNKSVYVKVT